MSRRLIAWLRLSRPHFLAGGLVVYALGALIARWAGAAIDWPIYWLGQLAVTSIQLMTHFVNEYWDVESDRLNRNRTWFSGGSGVLADARIGVPRVIALRGAIICLTVGTAAMAWLSVRYHVGPGAWLIFGLAVTGAWFYSSPPVALAGTGFGELTTALIVSALVPTLASYLQSRQIGVLLLAAAAPLAALSWATITVFEFPDLEADRAVGKRTVLLRLGRGRTVQFVTLAMLGAFGLLAMLPTVGTPPQVRLATLTLPLALVVIGWLWRLRRGASIHSGWLTFGAIALFGLTAALEAIGFFLGGNVL